MPSAPRPEQLELHVGQMCDGRWCCLASYVHPDGTREVVTVGIGATRAEAIADCRDDIPAALAAES